MDTDLALSTVLVIPFVVLVVLGLWLLTKLDKRNEGDE
jgi:hypothetical protein